MPNQQITDGSSKRPRERSGGHELSASQDWNPLVAKVNRLMTSAGSDRATAFEIEATSPIQVPPFSVFGIANVDPSSSPFRPVARVEARQHNVHGNIGTLFTNDTLIPANGTGPIRPITPWAPAFVKTETGSITAGEMVGPLDFKVWAGRPGLIALSDKPTGEERIWAMVPSGVQWFAAEVTTELPAAVGNQPKQGKVKILRMNQAVPPTFTDHTSPVVKSGGWEIDCWNWIRISVPVGTQLWVHPAATVGLVVASKIGITTRYRGVIDSVGSGTYQVDTLDPLDGNGIHTAPLTVQDVHSWGGSVGQKIRIEWNEESAQWEAYQRDC